jgi:hypothetical protein
VGIDDAGDGQEMWQESGVVSGLRKERNKRGARAMGIMRI